MHLSYPWGAFYTPAGSMATICPYHQLHSAALSTGRLEVVFHFDHVCDSHITAPSCSPPTHPPSPRIPWLTDNGTKLLSTHLCMCVTCPAWSPPSVMVNHLGRSNWSTWSLCPLALPVPVLNSSPAQGELREGLRSGHPSLTSEACRNQARMGGPV